MQIELNAFFKIKIIAQMFLVLGLAGCSKSNPVSDFRQWLIPIVEVYPEQENFFAVPTPCSGFTVVENQPFTCNQTGAVDDLWYFGSNHTCQWLHVEQEQGLVYGTPTWGQLGTCVLHIQALSSDPTPVSTEYTITVTNATPTLTLPTGTINEDQAMSVVLTAAQVEANEEVAGFGTYTLNDSTVVGTPLCANSGQLAINSVNGELRFKPNANYFGTCYFGIQFNDGQGQPNSSVIANSNILIAGINDAPIVTLLSTYTFMQNQVVSITPTSLDVDGDTLSFSFAAANTCSWVTINPTTGVVSGTPNDNQVGTCTLAIRAYDGTVYSAQATSSIVVRNLRPTLSIDDVSISAGVGMTVIRTDAQVQASDEGFGVYSFDHATLTGVRCIDHGILSINETTGAISFDPVDTYHGVCQIKVVFDDQNPTDNIVTDQFTVYVGGNPGINITLATPTVGSYVNRNNQNAFTVAGTCSEIGQIVRVKFSTITLNTTCTVAGTFSTNLNLSLLPDSTGNLLEVTHFDASMNQKTVVLDIDKDTISLDTMAFALVNPTTQEGFINNISFNVTGLPLDTASVNVYSNSNCTASIGTVNSYTTQPTQIIASVSSGTINRCQTHRFYARYTDQAGNQSTCSAVNQTYQFYGYRRNITFSQATLTAEQIVNVNLTTSNFDYGRIRSNAEDVRFVDTSGNILNYFIETLSTTGNSTFVLKVPLANTSQVNMYYCQPDVPLYDNVIATFSFSTQRNLYVDMVSSAQNYAVASYSNANDILFTGGNTATLNQNGVSNLASVNRGVVMARGPISARARSATGNDTVAAYTFLGTQFGYPISSGTSTWTFYNPASTSTTVTVVGYGALATITSNQTATVPAAGFVTVNTNGFDVVSYATTGTPVLAYFVSSNTEAMLIPPMTTQVYGVVTGSAWVAAQNNSTTVNVYYSDATIQTVVLNRGQRLLLNGGGTQGAGLAVRVVGSLPITAASINDGDGNDGFSYWPGRYLDRVYLLPTGAQYVSIVCPETTTIEMIDPPDTVTQTITCTSPGAGYPGKAFLGSSSNVTSFTAGRRLVSNKKIFAFYEYTTVDETNLMGPSHARPYSSQSITLTVGSETAL